MAVIKPRLIVIAGPNGSGKTALTTELRKAYNWADGLIEVNPDVIAEEKFDGWNDVNSIRKAADFADQVREECLLNKTGLLFEMVLSTQSKIEYVRRAKDAGFFVRLIFVATESPQINADRVAWRVLKGAMMYRSIKLRPVIIDLSVTSHLKPLGLLIGHILSITPQIS